ncbi:MAG: hypothetical protein CFE32_21625, partial [Alphaproteobacteria bacterium PA3]
MAYSNATKAIVMCLHELTGEEFTTAKMGPKDRFLDALDALRKEFEQRVEAKADLMGLGEIVGPLNQATTEAEIQRIIESAMGKSL